MIMLSIIIPHYNSPEKLERLLNSIPEDENIETIVVDDRSNKDLENLEKVKAHYQNHRIRFFSNNLPNKGAGTCRNIGMSKASGQWYLFADADDYFENNFYDKAKSYFESEYDVVFFKPTSWDEVRGEVSNRHILYSDLVEKYIRCSKSIKNQLLLRYKFVSPYSKLIRAEIVKKNKILFDEVIASNDVMFSTKLGYYANRISASEEVIYCITKNKGTLTQNISIEVLRSRLNVSINTFVFLKKSLPKKHFEYLELRSIGHLVTVVKYRLGWSEFIFTYKELRKNKFRIVSMSLFNPITVIKKTYFHLTDLFNSKSYKIKD